MKTTSDNLVSCTKCGRVNFTPAGLVHHRCRPAGANSEGAKGAKDLQPATSDLKPAAAPESASSRRRLPKEPALPISDRTTATNTAIPMSTKIPLHKRDLIHRPLSDLTIHPAIEGDPRLATKDPRYKKMCRAWLEQGGVPPIFVTPKGEIVDGRHRYWWLLEQSEDPATDTAPCIEVSEDEVHQVVIGAITGRNHQTKGQVAFFAAPKLQRAFEALQERRIEILKSGGKMKLPNLPTPEELAEQLGISETLLRQARKVHEAFAVTTKFKFQDGKTRTLKAHFEPLILAPEGTDDAGLKLPMSLGDVLKGAGYFLSGDGTNKSPAKPARNSALNNYLAQLKGLAKQAKMWPRWNDGERDLVAKGLETTVAALPAEMLPLMEVALRKAKRAATQAGGGEPAED